MSIITKEFGKGFISQSNFNIRTYNKFKNIWNSKTLGETNIYFPEKYCEFLEQIGYADKDLILSQL